MYGTLAVIKQYRCPLSLTRQRRHAMGLARLKQAVGGRPPQYTPSPVTLTFDLLTLKVVSRITCDVGYLCVNFSLPRHLCSRFMPMYATDVRQTDRQQGRSDGRYIGIYTPKISLPLKNLCGCSSPVTQDRFNMIYVHVWDIDICFEIAIAV